MNTGTYPDYDGRTIGTMTFHGPPEVVRGGRRWGFVCTCGNKGKVAGSYITSRAGVQGKLRCPKCRLGRNWAAGAVKLRGKAG